MVGRDAWPVERVQTLDSDPNSLWIALPDCMPADQVRLDYRVAFQDGQTLSNTIHLTIHALPPR